jgi:hypothetical protein
MTQRLASSISKMKEERNLQIAIVDAGFISEK